MARAVPEERAKLETLRSLMLDVPGGNTVPLAQVATLSYALEPPLIWRRQRLPTVTVQADIAPGIEAATVVRAARLEPLRHSGQSCRPGYDVVARRHGRGQRQGARPASSPSLPLMLFVMITILMVQLQSFQRLFLVLADGAAGAHRGRRGAADLGRAAWGSSPSSASSRWSAW